MLERQLEFESTAPSPSPFLSQSQMYASLNQQMEVAAKFEDYEDETRILDSLKMLEKEEPILLLWRLIKGFY
ncbi:hypothetical protein RchiOBHm_Chr6g0279701 [Rosa chinensis]|uniref:Uncharacterized protein n=1 Tax=Rosa chinensis TaxID=74649 RepID=A0A2P6PT16_ROSCH|nr:hypothetical protein RchiOBHm_Chr6g0279701 [Rosa chinensis]